MKAATSKAVVAGLEYSKWTPARFDANQDFVLGALHGDKDDILKEINPCILSGRKLRIKNGVDHQWSEFKLCITAVTLAEFRETWSNSNKE